MGGSGSNACSTQPKQVKPASLSVSEEMIVKTDSERTCLHMSVTANYCERGFLRIYRFPLQNVTLKIRKLRTVSLRYAASPYRALLSRDMHETDHKLIP